MPLWRQMQVNVSRTLLLLMRAGGPGFFSCLVLLFVFFIAAVFCCFLLPPRYPHAVECVGYQEEAHGGAAIRCCVVNPSASELFTGGRDRKLMVRILVAAAAILSLPALSPLLLAAVCVQKTFWLPRGVLGYVAVGCIRNRVVRLSFLN